MIKIGEMSDRERDLWDKYLKVSDSNFQLRTKVNLLEERERRYWAAKERDSILINKLKDELYFLRDLMDG